MVTANLGLSCVDVRRGGVSSARRSRLMRSGFWLVYRRAHTVTEHFAYQHCSNATIQYHCDALRLVSV